MTKLIQTSVLRAQEVIDATQRKLKLHHWTIVVSKTSPSPQHYMEIAITRTRNYAAIRISDQAWREMNTRSFTQGIKHEMMHILLDPILDEYEIQQEGWSGMLPPERTEEYDKRYHQLFEKIVDTLAHVV